MTGDAKRIYQRLYMRERRRTARAMAQQVNKMLVEVIGRRGLRRMGLTVGRGWRIAEANRRVGPGR